MTIQTRTVDYYHNGETFEAFLAWNDEHTGPRPGVLVSHAFRGREQFECDKVVALAEPGYVGFALDLYGKGITAETKEQAFALMNGLTENRPLLQSRLTAVIEAAQGVAEIDESRLAAMGFCFGGLCVLEMARTGLPVAGVASFHGILSAPDNTQGKPINCKVLVEHGWDDPMATPQQVLEFTQEMTAAGADWQLHAHGNAMPCMPYLSGSE